MPRKISRRRRKKKLSVKKRNQLIKLSKKISATLISAFIFILISSEIINRYKALSYMMSDTISHYNNELSIAAGFILDEIEIEGNNIISREHILKHSQLNIGTPTETIDLQSTYDKLTAITWIKKLRLQRIYPNKIKITIEEHTPIALWKDTTMKLYAITESLTLIKVENNFDTKNLITFIGKGAVEESLNAMKILKKNTELYSRIKYLERIGERRWNVVLDNIKIKLPEEDMIDAWQYLSNINLNDNIIDNNIKIIDLRLKDKIFVR